MKAPLYLENRINDVLHLLNIHSRVSTAELCSHLHIAPSTARKLLADMEKEGLPQATRDRDMTNARVNARNFFIGIYLFPFDFPSAACGSAAGAGIRKTDAPRSSAVYVQAKRRTWPFRPVFIIATSVSQCNRNSKLFSVWSYFCKSAVKAACFRQIPTEKKTFAYTEGTSPAGRGPSHRESIPFTAGRGPPFSRRPPARFSSCS